LTFNTVYLYLQHPLSAAQAQAIVHPNPADYPTKY
jgi:hypothetical protein